MHDMILFKDFTDRNTDSERDLLYSLTPKVSSGSTCPTNTPSHTSSKNRKKFASYPSD